MADTPVTPQTDINTVHMVIKGIIALAVLFAGCAMALTWHGDKDVALVMLGPAGTSVGILGGMLVNPRTNKPATDNDPMPTKIITTPDTPVNVVENPAPIPPDPIV